MERDSTLERTAPPIPAATYEILGGGGVQIHAREWGNPGAGHRVHPRLVAERSLLAKPGTR